MIQLFVVIIPHLPKANTDSSTHTEYSYFEGAENRTNVLSAFSIASSQAKHRRLCQMPCSPYLIYGSNVPSRGRQEGTKKIGAVSLQTQMDSS